jgi:hypothetical protein
MVAYARHILTGVDLGEQLNELVIKKQAIVQERFCTGRKTFASDAKGQSKTRSSFALFETRKEATMT